MPLALNPRKRTSARLPQAELLFQSPAEAGGAPEKPYPPADLTGTSRTLPVDNIVIYGEGPARFR